MELRTIPLRFRVWDRENKCFLTESNLTDLADFYRQICFVDHEHFEIFIGGNKRFVVSQDTGLKDRNGESIYVGDIIREESIRKGKYIYGVIQYMNGAVDCNNLILGASFPYRVAEKVGTIWQNPELLKGVKY